MPLPTPSSEQVYWDESLPGFGVKVTPAGRKVCGVVSDIRSRIPPS
jgi:hypothetical protein